MRNHRKVSENQPKTSAKTMKKLTIKQGIFEERMESLEFPMNPLKPAQRNPVLGDKNIFFPLAMPS